MEQPLYGADFYQSVKRFFGKYATFSGRASRSEYWWFCLFNSIVYLVLFAVFIVLGVGGMDPVTGEMGLGAAFPLLLLTVYWLGTFVPNIALCVRRLHDGNFSGLLYLLTLIPFFGGAAPLHPPAHALGPPPAPVSTRMAERQPARPCSGHPPGIQAPRSATPAPRPAIPRGSTLHRATGSPPIRRGASHAPRMSRRFNASTESPMHTRPTPASRRAAGTSTPLTSGDCP